MKKLLPYKLKFLGLFCIAAAVVLSVTYFYFGPRISVPVFAVVSSYLETKIFATFETNFFDELVLLLYIAGFSLLVFSREKDESRYLRIVRIKALIKTIPIYISWMIFSIIFIYGNAFIATLVINIIFPFFVYLLFFYIIKQRELKKARLRNLQNKIARSISQSA